MAVPTPERALFGDSESQMASINANAAADEVEPLYRRRGFRFSVIAVAVVGIVVAIGLVFGGRAASSTSSARSGEFDSPLTTPSPSGLPTPAPTPAPASSVKDVLTSAALGGGSEFEDETSYQSQALAWLEGNTDVATYSEAKIIQRYAMACFFYTTFGVENDYTGAAPVEWKNYDKWVTDDDECTWHGVNCTDADIVSVDLADNNVTGTVPAEFGLLGQSLKILDLSGNSVANKDEGLSWIAELTELTELHLYFCNFDSHGITSYIGALTKLGKYFVCC
jgi:hypothetical protein